MSTEEIISATAWPAELSELSSAIFLSFKTRMTQAMKQSGSWKMISKSFKTLILFPKEFLSSMPLSEKIAGIFYSQTRIPKIRKEIMSSVKHMPEDQIILRAMCNDLLQGPI